MIVLLVMVFGGVGAAGRFVVDGLIRQRWATTFPVATVFVNVSGSLLIGVLTGARLFHHLDQTVYLVATLGFCGGYTTFSTAMVETVRLIQSGNHRQAFANTVGSLLLAVGAASLGVALLWALR